MLLFLGLVMVCGGGEPLWRLEDDFSAVPAPERESRWETGSIGFRWRDGKVHHDAGMLRGFLVLCEAPLAKALTLETTLVVREDRGTQWDTAGIGIYLDDRNFWHLALVESPDSDGRRHFCEMAEMLEGNWNAQFAPGSSLRPGPGTAGDFAWEYGVSYRLRLSLSREGDVPALTGEIFEGETLRFRRVLFFDARAVERGRPMLTAGGFAVDFDEFETSIFALAEEGDDEPRIPDYDSVFSSIDPRLEATGSFRVKAEHGIWWMVDPAGRKTFSLGVDHVNYREHWCEKLGYAPYHRRAEAKYGNAESWARAATDRLKSWRFNTLGAGHSEEARYRGLAHTEFVALGSDFSSIAALVEKTTWTGFPDVFDERWERFCDLRARKKCRRLRRDPWLLGYFLDNELEWWGKTHQPIGMALETAKLPPAAAGKRALVRILRDFYRGDFGKFREDFEGEEGGFDFLLKKTEWPPPRTERGREALLAFVDEAARRYYEVATAAIRRHDPNHLILGNRFAGDAPEAAWNWAGRTCDIVTVNVYPRANLVTGEIPGLADFLTRRHEQVGKPLMITEWSYPALDAVDSEGRPLPSRHGAGMRVDTQEQRARCFAMMQRTLASLPFVVGSQYFMWCDEPALGISSTFPEDSNYGLVRETDEPYREITETAARVNGRMVELHGGRIDVGAVTLPEAKLPEAGRELSRVPGAVSLIEKEGGFLVETGALKWDVGAAVNRLHFRERADGDWIELGSFQAVLHLVAGDGETWLPADRIADIARVELSEESLVLDVTFARNAKPSWQACYRFAFGADEPFFRSRARWIENEDEIAWTLGGYFHYAVPRIRGDASDDEVAGAVIPNYYRPIASWTDGSGMRFGVEAPVGDSRIWVHFWKDVTFHPDACREIEVEVKPGERWTAPENEPVVTVFGGRR